MFHLGEKYLIMAFETTNINYITDLGINYIPCCKIVLMFYNYLYPHFHSTIND